MVCAAASSSWAQVEHQLARTGRGAPGAAPTGAVREQGLGACEQPAGFESVSRLCLPVRKLPPCHKPAEVIALGTLNTYASRVTGEHRSGATSTVAGAAVCRKRSSACSCCPWFRFLI